MARLSASGDWSGFEVEHEGTVILEWDNGISPLPTWDDVEVMLDVDNVQVDRDELHAFMLERGLLARTDR